MKGGEPTAERAPALSVALRGLRKRYGTVEAVKGVDLDIRDGEFFALLGPSGCGKTTTLKMIGGFEQPTSGEVFIGGEPVAGLPPQQRHANMVFQHYALFPHLNARDNVAFGLRMRRVGRRERERRAESALERVHLTGYGSRRVQQLSGGEQQRVALARALVNEPAVLLLDEPLGALDLKLRRAMQDELKTIQREVGISFVYVTHDQEEALSMADSVAVMHDGRLEQTGPPAEVYDRPATRFVADFVGTSSFLAGKVATTGAGEVVLQLPGGTTVRAPARPQLGLRSSTATAMVRPERITLTAIGEPVAPDRNSLQVTVHRYRYAGSDRFCHTQTASGDKVIVRLAGAPTTVPAEPGTECLATFPVSDTVLLAE